MRNSHRFLIRSYGLERTTREISATSIGWENRRGSNRNAEGRDWRLCEGVRRASRKDDGRAQPWHGRVWCNPPYSQPALYQFCEKMAEHGNGILLIFARTGNKVWQEIIFPRATAVLFLRRRVRFCLPDGTQAGSAGCDSALVAFGWNNVEALEKSGIEGKLVILK